MFVSCRCAACERRFDTQILLEYHKDQFAHWTEEDLAAYWYDLLIPSKNNIFREYSEPGFRVIYSVDF